MIRYHTSRWPPVADSPYPILKRSCQRVLDIKNKRLWRYITVITCFIKLRRTQQHHDHHNRRLLIYPRRSSIMYNHTYNELTVFYWKRRALRMHDYSRFTLPSYTHVNRYLGRRFLHSPRATHVSQPHHECKSGQFILLHGGGKTSVHDTHV
jgi:hypothetical protein